MAISQIIWSLDDKEQLQPAELINKKELEDILAEHIEILDADWLLIGRQVRTVAGKFIDLLCMDHDGDLIVRLRIDLLPRIQALREDRATVHIGDGLLALGDADVDLILCKDAPKL